MSQGTNEPQGPPNGHPAWQEYLNEVPEDLQPLVAEAFKKWDENVNGKLQGEREKFEPYKPLLENGVPMDAIEQSLWLAQQIQEDPKAIVGRLIEAYELDYLPKEAVQQVETPPNPEEEFNMDDLTGLENHPTFKALQKQAEELAEWRRQQEEAQQEQEASTELELFLKSKHEDESVGAFDDLFVTALMAQGVEFDDAAKQYQSIIANGVQQAGGQQQQQQQTPPPVVVGGAGNSGSGIPEELPRMGDLRKNDLNAAVLQMLAAGDSNNSNG